MNKNTFYDIHKRYTEGGVIMNFGRELKSISDQITNNQMSMSTDEFITLIRPQLLEVAKQGSNYYWFHLECFTGYDVNRSLLIDPPISGLRERLPFFI